MLLNIICSKHFKVLLFKKSLMTQMLSEIELMMPLDPIFEVIVYINVSYVTFLCNLCSSRVFGYLLMNLLIHFLFV